MRYEAKIENGVVTDTIVCDDNYNHNLPGFWVEYNENDRVNIGDTYTTIEGFRPPKPYDSWLWDDIKKLWDSPIPLPDEENIYQWNESTQIWVMIYMKV